jgi:hypothetical protein
MLSFIGQIVRVIDNKAFFNIGFADFLFFVFHVQIRFFSVESTTLQFKEEDGEGKNNPVIRKDVKGMIFQVFNEKIEA